MIEENTKMALKVLVNQEKPEIETTSFWVADNIFRIENRIK